MRRETRDREQAIEVTMGILMVNDPPPTGYRHGPDSKLIVLDGGMQIEELDDERLRELDLRIEES